MATLRGEMQRDEAIAKGQQHTRNYAKRQMTWLRNQLPEAIAVTKAEEILAQL
jgi:tRNA dimethylallyltransferase